jgi:hypothetical protein
MQACVAEVESDSVICQNCHGLKVLYTEEEFC